MPGTKAGIYQALIIIFGFLLQGWLLYYLAGDFTMAVTPLSWNQVMYLKRLNKDLQVTPVQASWVLGCVCIVGKQWLLDCTLYDPAIIAVMSYVKVYN